MRHILFLLLFCLSSIMRAQELNCTVKIIHTQVQGTNTQIFETLENAITEFMNNRSWTEMQFQQEERIECTLNITITKYEQGIDQFTGEILWQLARPVFNSTYNSTVFSMRDKSFVFTYKEFDPLDWNENNIDNNLTAVLAYYAYLFIGMDLDTFSPLGGTDILHIVENIVNNAQTLGDPGWAAFKDSRNRHAIITDYMEPSLEGLRSLQYKYYREGMDEMANNSDRGRTAITEAIEMLNEAYHNKPMSQLPQIFTDFKRDEIINIYKGHGTDKERQKVRDICSNMNASQNTYWDQIK